MCFATRLFACLVFLSFLSVPLLLTANEPADVELEDEPIAAAESSQSELATEHMVGVYYGYVASDTETRLEHSGLAQPEIAFIVDSVAQEFASCVVGSLVKANNPETEFTIKLLAEGVPLEEVSDYMDSLSTHGQDDPLAVFETELRACSESIDASYGLY